MTNGAKKDYEVVIVGAGPAGASAAIRLGGSGVRVLLVEQKQFPRPKLCGEFISPECLAHFAELDVLDAMSLAGGVALERTVFYARDARSVTVPSEWFGSGSYALGLSRAEMDLQLMTRARSAGAEVMEDTQAAGLILENNKVCGVRLRGSDRAEFSVRSPLTIDATGRARILARYIEKATGSVRPVRAEFVAFKTHLEDTAVPPGDCEIYAYRGGYGGSSRVENGLDNFCFIVSAAIAKKHGGDARTLMQNVVFTNKRALHSLGKAQIVDEWLAVPIARYGRADLAPAEGLLTVGDAAAFIDPFTGSGILLALESSRIAADHIGNEFALPAAERSFASIAGKYALRYSATFDRRLRVCSLLRHAAFVPFFAETVIRALSLSERLTRRLVRATRFGGQSRTVF